MQCYSAWESRAKGLGKSWLNMAKTEKKLARAGNTWQKLASRSLQSNLLFTQKEMPRSIWGS